MTARWVIGRGLLGRAVAEELGGTVFNLVVEWTDPERSLQQLTAGLLKFLAEGTSPWEIYWCAGAGITSSDRAATEIEVGVFTRFIDAVGGECARSTHSGAVFLASSVGGAYAGNPRPPFSEFSETAPLSAYGEAKLRMEEALTASASRFGYRAFIARITNLYGPGQDLSKGQGLISTIARTYLTGQPASIFVPLDTLRDYVYVKDCASVIVAGVARVSRAPAGSVTVKIVGSAAAVSIGALISEFSRLRRHRPLIVLGAGDSRGQAPDLRVRSEVWTDLDSLVSTTLPAGIAATFQSLFASTTRAPL